MDLYDFDTAQRVKYKSNFKAALKGSRSVDALRWVDDFIWRVCPDEKVWSWNGNKEIQLFPGFVNGDPTNARPFALGDVNVHGLIAGGTGAGKSVLLNHLIATLTRCYAPSELELWLCDFKGSEFVSYIASPIWNYALPHLKCCLCTSDGAYASSVMDALKVESERRYKLLMDNKKGSLKDWNKMCENNIANHDTSKDWAKERMPRVVMLADEFQNMFESADDDQVEVIKKALTYVAKIGRQCGVHMLFASQSLTGTLSADVLNQFKLRMCLKADASVSQDLIGSDLAAKIPYPKGFMYVTDNTIIDPKDAVYFKTPFIISDTEYDKEGKPIIPTKLLNVKYQDDKAKAEGVEPKKIISYIESTKHPLEEMSQIFEKNRVTLKSEAPLIIFGNRMAYSPTNPGPLNKQFLNVGGEHIYSQFNNQIDYIDFSKQIMECLKQNGVPKVFVNIQDSDMGYLCELDKYDFINHSLEDKAPTEFVEIIKATIEKRQSDNDKSQLWCICYGWNKAEGVGLNSDYELAKEIYTMHSRAPLVGIHMIYISNGPSKINSQVFESCNCIIAGKVDADSSMNLLNKKWASREFPGIKDGYMYCSINGSITRVKIYQSPKSDREVIATELHL